MDKITMVCHGSDQGYHVKDTIEPFSVIVRVRPFLEGPSMNAWKPGKPWLYKTGITSKAASGNIDLGKDNMVLNIGSYQKKRICYHGSIVKNMVNLGILAKIMVSWLAFARSSMAIVSLPRSWQDHGMILARLARNLPWILARITWLPTLGC